MKDADKPLSQSLDFLETVASALVKGVRSNVERTIKNTSSRPLSPRDKRRVKAVAGGLRLAADLVTELVDDDTTENATAFARSYSRKRGGR